MTFRYLLAKFIRYMHIPTVADVSLEKPVRIYPESTVIGTSMGRYSYCAGHCTLINCEIGRYCSIAEGVSVGMGSHPVDWVSTSPAFHLCKGRSVPRDLASLHYDAEAPRTIIGHDVWIGMNVLIKPGVTIGNGAVIGMGSVVTKDVPPYTIVAGNPAHVIRPRFERPLADRLEASRWWDLDPKILKAYSHLMNKPLEFLNALEEIT